VSKDGAQAHRDAYFANTRRVIAPLLPDRIQSVLEIGCGEGNTLEWLNLEHGPIESCGIEIDAQAAEAARLKGLSVHVLDIENAMPPIAEGSVDLLLCLDVLDHMRDPWKTLAHLIRFLKPDGSVIVSIPNVAHVSVLAGLVLGDDWTYQSEGILDRTHLRFFTGKTSKQLLVSAGLNVDRIKRYYSRKTHRRINFLTAGLFRRFFTYQYLMRARKRLAAPS
jgi:SAM-dependent methyltransferase